MIILEEKEWLKKFVQSKGSVQNAINELDLWVVKGLEKAAVQELKGNFTGAEILMKSCENYDNLIIELKKGG